MIITKDKLEDWIDHIRKYNVIAPAMIDGNILFLPVDDPRDIVLEDNSIQPPKKALFPQTETMFTYTIGKNMNISASGTDPEKRIIFGIRPCDAKSFAVLDHVFNGEHKDDYYLRRRENTILIGLACKTPDINCFCTSLDSGPGSKADVDVLLTDIGDRYYLEVVTEKGKALLDERNDLFTPASDDDEGKKQEMHTQAEELMKRSIEVNAIPEKLGRMFESDYWKKISLKCLGCGICTYVCPTCHCFDVQDEMRGFKGRRARMWDSCMYPEYTIHTSGHNPRPARMNRIRNRVYHKFKYYPNNFNEYLCVGCGRCVDKCPVNIDIIDIINTVGGGQYD